MRARVVRLGAVLGVVLLASLVTAACTDSDRDVVFDIYYPDLGDFVPEEDGAGPPPPTDAVGGADAGTPCECTDQILCTNEFCDENGACQHENITPISDAVVGQPAPDFELEDVNPESATFGDTFSRATLNGQGKVLILAFHAANCQSCIEQGEAARTFHAGIAANTELFFASINSDDAAAVVDDYVNADTAAIDGPAPPSTWPVLQDTAAAGVWDNYCSDTDVVVVVDADGFVRYMRAVNFDDAPFVDELQAAIERARTVPIVP